MRQIVLDASVAVKWYLPREGEDLVDDAFDLLGHHRLQTLRFAVPDVFWAEFGNVMWKAARQRRLSEHAAKEAMKDIASWEIQVFAARDMLEGALNLAMVHGRSLYDSLYVMTAIRAHSELITADERLVNALGTRFPVRWLGAFSIS